MLEELSLQLGHIDVGRTFGFAALTAEAEIHYFIDLLMIITIGFVGVGKEFTQDISPGPCGVLFITRSHKRRAHGATRQMGLAAVAGTITLLRMLQDVLAMESEDRGKGRRLLACLIAQHGIHGRRVYDLVGVEYIFRVPAFFDQPHQLVILLPYHLRDELASQSAVPMLTA